jgi:hypothetical protein
MSRGRRVVLASLGVGLWPAAAIAQTALEDTIRSRFPAAEYKPIGVDLGFNEAYLLFPRVEVTVGHTDNLFRDEIDRVADEIVTFAPSLDLKSDWDNHALDLSLRSAIARHVDNGAEDFEDAEAALRGRLDVTEVDRLLLLTSAARRHQERGSPDDEDEPNPTIYHTAAATLTAEHDNDVGLARLIASAERTDFEDNGPTDNDDRDRDELELRARVGYELVDGTLPFVEAAANNRTYDRRIDNDGIRRGSDGWEVLAGTTLDVSGVTFLEGAVGFRHQDFDEPTFDAIDDLTFKGRAVWNATDLVTLSLRVERTIEESALTGASSVEVTETTIGADWSPLEEVLASAQVGYGIDAFDGIDRTDDRLRLNLGVQYLIGSNFVVGADVRHDRRMSDAPGNDYDASEVAFRFGSQL